MAVPFRDSLEMAEQAAPGTPTSGTVAVYAKTDGLLYVKDDTGTERPATLADIAAGSLFGRAVGAGTGTPGVLTLAQVLAIIAAWNGSPLSEYVAVVETFSGTTATLGNATTATGKVARFTSASAVAVTLAATAAVGTTYTIVQAGAGQLTFSTTGSGTIRQRITQLKSAGQWAMLSAVVVANVGGSAAEWVLSGDTTW